MVGALNCECEYLRCVLPFESANFSMKWKKLQQTLKLTHDWDGSLIAWDCETTKHKDGCDVGSARRLKSVRVIVRVVGAHHRKVCESWLGEKYKRSSFSKQALLPKFRWQEPTQGLPNHKEGREANVSVGRKHRHGSWSLTFVGESSFQRSTVVLLMRSLFSYYWCRAHWQTAALICPQRKPIKSS